jgi:hypothetical protein
VWAITSYDLILKTYPSLQFPVPANRSARVIVMIETDSELEDDPCDDPTPAQIAHNIRQAFQEKQAGHRISLNQLWDGIAPQGAPFKKALPT